VTSSKDKTNGWVAAGEAWGARALDWAYLAEGASIRTYLDVLDVLRLDVGSSVVDVACGAGRALVLAEQRSVKVAGIDASPALIAVAAHRVPAADLRVGDMDVLPWPDASFDAAMSFNGVWAGSQVAVSEAARILRPGGRLALAFFANSGPLDSLVPLIALAGLVESSDVSDQAQLLNIATPGVAEEMVGRAGLRPVLRGVTSATAEWPDFDTAWRAVSSTGMAYAALQRCDESVARDAVRDAIAGFWTDTGGYRLVTRIEFVVAAKPAAPTR
jgi:SAM-dependent methyltransferase